MEYTILILLLPLASFLVLGLAGMKMRPAAAGAVGTAVLAVVALLSYWTAFEYCSAGRDAAGVFPTLIPWNAVWLPIGGALHIDLGILLDPISVMMLVVISTVSLIVRIYSTIPHKGQAGLQRYYAFLSLFTMSMVTEVVATKHLRCTSSGGWWRQLLPADRLLHTERKFDRFEEAFIVTPRRPGLCDRHPDLQLLRRVLAARRTLVAARACPRWRWD